MTARPSHRGGTAFLQQHRDDHLESDCNVGPGPDGREVGEEVTKDSKQEASQAQKNRGFKWGPQCLLLVLSLSHPVMLTLCPVRVQEISK